MKKSYILLSVLLTMSLNACRNTISNNCDTTFKIVEITQANTDLKQQHVLPDEYVTNEEKACTLKPGDEADFGGHYLPKYIIYKQYPDEKWRPLLYVKQTKCAPDGADASRFPENKYLLITDLLDRNLPHDYQEVYSFEVKAPLQDLSTSSSNEKTLHKIKNPYQELYVLIDDFTQKAQELFSEALKKQEQQKPQPTENETSSDDTDGANEDESCKMCHVPEAA